MLAAGDLRAALAERRRDHLRQRDVRDAMLRERGSELRRRHAPDLRRVWAEEQAVEGAAHGLDDPVLRRDERPRAEATPQRLHRVVGERARREDRRHGLRDVERLERVLVVAAAELDAHVLGAGRKAVGRDLFEHVEHALVARVIGVRPEVVPRAGLAAQGRRESAKKMLSLKKGDPLAVLGQGESGGKATDAATEDDGVTQEVTSLGVRSCARRAV